MDHKTFTITIHSDKAKSIAKDEKRYQAVSDWISKRRMECVMERYRFRVGEGGDQYRLQLQVVTGAGDPL